MRCRQATIVKLLVLVAVSVMPFRAVAAGENEGCAREKYLYEAVPKGDDGKVVAQFEVSNCGTLRYTADFSTGEKEEIDITVTREGEFVSAMRTFSHLANNTSQQKVTVDREKGEISIVKGSKKPTLVTLPEDRELAVDGSILMLFRFFPFDQGEQWQLFMVDFSSLTFKLAIKQAAKEMVTVPAGTFECYRLDAMVAMSLIHPRISYWISATKPHFLVKHEGRRGPFSPEYVTSLIAIQKN